MKKGCKGCNENFDGKIGDNHLYNCVCGKIIKKGDKVCPSCGAELKWVEKFKLRDRLLFLVPYILFLFACLSLFWGLIGAFDQYLDPKYSAFKTVAYNNVSLILFLLSVVFGIFMLFIELPKRDKLWALSRKLLGVLFILLMFLYSKISEDFKNQLLQQERQFSEYQCREKGYDNCSDMIHEILRASGKL